MTVTYDYSGKNVLVTGGTRGIGLGIARAFAAAGANVTVTGTRDDASSYDDDLSGFSYLKCRMNNAEERAAVADALPALDVLVNNAGASGSNEFAAEGVAEVLEMNVTAMADLCYRFKDKLAAAEDGTIINLTSIGGSVGMAGFPAYSASKHAIIGLTRSLADKWAKKGVRVNAIAPGFIETAATEWLRNNEAAAKATLYAIPQGRFGQPEDIAKGALFLASDGSEYIRGHVLTIDGGFLLR